MAEYIKCDTCPRCKDEYPGKLDRDGYHFYICGMSGNIVYKEYHEIRRIKGSGYIRCPVSGCGLYKSVEDALSDMTEPEIARYKAALGGDGDA